MKAKKFFALSLSAILSLALLAGCGTGGNTTENGGQNPGGDGGEQDNPPETPEKPDREAAAFSDQQATVSLSGAISKDAASTVSEDLFGLFLEDINYASQAMDDNMIANGSFESSVQVSNLNHDYAWTTGNGLSFTAETGEKKLHVNNPFYAQISTAAGGTLTNAGFDAAPMYILNKGEYLFSAFFRGYRGEVTVRAATSSKTCAEKTFSVNAPDDEWIKVEETVTATSSSAVGVSLTISFGSEDRDVLLDAVQFETKDATVGIKNYMYKAISDLSPAFFRFPGGCVIEGTNINNAYDWKNSIGAVKDGDNDILPAFEYKLYKDGVESEAETYGEWATRVPNGNIWQRSGKYYPHEYGVGFYEYFCLCDSLGAKAIPIVNCGFSCQTQTGMPGAGVALQGRHGNKVADYIQDAIDLIEFAKGDESTEWGKIRANMGHPEPFEMDYIGIGNEQWGDYYEKYYEEFLKNDAFKAALKQYSVKPIVGNCTMFEHCENPNGGTEVGAAQGAAQNAVKNKIVGTVADYGVVDQHYYVNFTDFLLNTHLYDNYKRPASAPNDYYEVFVGEYAVNSQAIRAPQANDSVSYKHTDNSMLTALAEAAMMTGFERNGDIVKLAAYAPMFGTENRTDRQWQVDMMYFSNRVVTFTPNYYVQQLFMQNTGNYKVSAGIKYADGFSAPQTTYTAEYDRETRTCDDIFFVADLDEETGDVILKLVNAGKTKLKVNVDFSVTGLTPAGIADVVELSAESADAVNESGKEAVHPEKYTLGIGNVFGYELPPYTVAAIRIRTK